MFPLRTEMFCLRSLALITCRSTMKFLAMWPIIFSTLHLRWDHTPRYHGKFKYSVPPHYIYLYRPHCRISNIQSFCRVKKKEQLPRGKGKIFFGSQVVLILSKMLCMRLEEIITAFYPLWSLCG